MFNSPDGKISMMRILSFMICAVILGVFVAHNIMSMVNGGPFISVGFQESGLLALTLGAKAAQAFTEPKKKIETLSENELPKNGE